MPVSTRYAYQLTELMPGCMKRFASDQTLSGYVKTWPILLSCGLAAPCINLAIGGPSTFLGKEVHMPNIHYGRLPDTDLAVLWQSEICEFYRQQFERRAKKHDEAIVTHMLGASGTNRLKALQRAKEATPEPPQGCSMSLFI